jgi:hypothetical protein
MERRPFRHQGIAEIEPAQMMHSGKARHSGIAEGGIAEIERLQIHEGSEAVLLDSARVQLAPGRKSCRRWVRPKIFTRSFGLTMVPIRSTPVP